MLNGKLLMCFALAGCASPSTGMTGDATASIVVSDAPSVVAPNDPPPVTVDAHTPAGDARLTVTRESLALTVVLPRFEEVIQIRRANGVMTFDAHAVDNGHVGDISSAGGVLRVRYDGRLLQLGTVEQMQAMVPGAPVFDVDGNVVPVGETAFDAAAFQALLSELSAHTPPPASRSGGLNLPPAGLMSYEPMGHFAGFRPYGGSCEGCLTIAFGALTVCLIGAAIVAAGFSIFSWAAAAIGAAACFVAHIIADDACIGSPMCCPVACGMHCCDTGETCVQPASQRPLCTPPGFNLCGEGGCRNGDMCFLELTDGIQGNSLCCAGPQRNLCDSSGANPQYPNRHCCDDADVCNIRTGQCCRPGTFPMGQTCCTMSQFIAADPQSGVTEACCAYGSRPVGPVCCAAPNIAEAGGSIVTSAAECCSGADGTPGGPCIGASMFTAGAGSSCCGEGITCVHVGDTMATTGWDTPNQCCPPNPVWCPDHRTCCPSGEACVARAQTPDGRQYDCGEPFSSQFPGPRPRPRPHP